MDKRKLEQFIPLLIERLKPINPVKIILFGSHAYGTPVEQSDLDLLVVVDSDHFPKNFKEKSDLYLEVSRQIRDIRSEVPIDLIVHSKPMHQKFIEMNSIFSKEIAQKGIILYEANYQSMV